MRILHEVPYIEIVKHILYTYMCKTKLFEVSISIRFIRKPLKSMTWNSFYKINS